MSFSALVSPSNRMLHSSNEILLRGSKEQTTNICSFLDESQIMMLSKRNQSQKTAI